MNEQINVRLPEKLLQRATRYAKRHGFTNLQELMKESLRERVYGHQTISQEELQLVRRLAATSKKRKLYGTEAALRKKLKK